MFLRSVSIRGFKSFADKTVLEFAPGISVVVGPNGSGKSNLVDAISWVLGEQGPRALRGGQMADVIFAGSPSRAALGMAEVRLVIDNSAGLIPVPLTEIEVSRTVFRSGDSEYRIGGQLCRLLDVQELLAESGIGRGLHTVVGQGQLEEVLSARPEDRRRFVEEAAGIAKHRKRKERAERKLSGLERDLLRAEDVLAEVRRQLKPLKQQAEIAERHERLTAEADDLSVKLAAARLRDLRAERERRRAGWDEGLERRAAARARLDELDAEVVRAGEERAAASRALADDEARFVAAQSARSAAEHAYRRAVERTSAARTAVAERATTAARLAALDDELGRVEGELRRTVSDLVERELELDAAEGEFRARERARRDVEEERRNASERAAARRAEVETLRRALAAYGRDRARIARELGVARERIARADAERATLEEEVERLDARSTPLGDRAAALDEQRRTLADEVDRLEDEIRRTESRRALAVARLRDIEETPGSRFLAARRGRALGLLRDLVRAEAGLERALTAALGPLGDAVVYDDRDRALADAPEGDGAILAVTASAPVPFVLPEERSLLSAVAVEAPARALASLILRDVYLAPTTGDADEKHRRHPTASFVTPEGVVIGPAAIHTASAADDRTGRMRSEVAAMDHEIAAARATLRRRRDELAEAVGRAERIAEEIRGCDEGITAAAERGARLAADLASLRKEEELLAQRLVGLDDAAASWREGLAGSEPADLRLPELPPAPEPPMAARVAVEALRRERSSHEARLGALRREREQLASRDGGALEEEVVAAEAEHAQRREELRAAEAAIEAAGSARERSVARERAAVEAETAVNRAWRDASHELDRLREAYEVDDRARGDLERRIRDAERLIREGHGREPDDALRRLADDDSADAIERRAQLVQRRLVLLGRVNLLATGEYHALQEREQFLARELDDVRRARRDLLEVIRRIDEDIAQTFASAYRDVAAEFARLIGTLFPGGEGRLELTDPAEPLTSGIEIEARPGRKRVRRISLLSGGERALTAMAFLFAIFRARPSPFYFLDEVEPALDDINLHRFLRLLEGFAADSQVLIVTHQKRTMEAAAMLYGVSMSPDGTSKVITQRLERREAAPPQEGRRAADHAPPGGPRPDGATRQDGPRRDGAGRQGGPRPDGAAPLVVPEPNAVG